jgi:hypothetical protein
MIRTTSSLLATAAIGAALLAGCGGGSNNSSSSTSNTTSSQAPAPKSATTSQSSTPHSTTPTAPANIGSIGGAAIAGYCQTALAAAKSLSATERNQFKAYCASLKNDSPAQLKGAEKTLCLEIVKDSVPAADRSIADTECAKL